MYQKYRKVKPSRQTEGHRLIATALKYDPNEDEVPQIVATGQGKIAEQIISLGKEHGIPVRDDPVLSMALAGVNLGDEIPPELYRVIAELLAYIYKVYGQVHPVSNGRESHR